MQLTQLDRRGDGALLQNRAWLFHETIAKGFFSFTPTSTASASTA
jgi:hypothetical protein